MSSERALEHRNKQDLVCPGPGEREFLARFTAEDRTIGHLADLDVHLPLERIDKIPNPDREKHE